MTVIGDRYVLSDRLGGGGYGEVFRAHDKNTGATVALKIFRRGDPSMLAYREAHVLYRLAGPHVLRVHNAETYDDRPCIATDVAPLGSAADHVGELGARPDHVLTWMSHLLDGLGACHALGVVHRDVKAENLFLDRPDHARLGDFGVAANMEPDGKVPPGGDHRVWPPEMFTTGRSDVRGDIWAAGVTAWRLLTGRYPFVAPSVAELETLVLRGPGRLFDAAPHVTPALARAIEKAMSQSPDDRYQSAAEMVHGLDLPPFRRPWQRKAACPGHDDCWVSEPDTGNRRASVCTYAGTGTNTIIESRRGAGLSRVKPLCLAVPPRQLSTTLRAVFKDL